MAPDLAFERNATPGWPFSSGHDSHVVAYPNRHSDRNSTWPEIIDLGPVQQNPVPSAAGATRSAKNA
ncbi:hypothetical protein AUK22_07180 [bacterium CG2_30_54_10]|nr:MAG: hypothetical protein AUK22_07180 [bacterium CG2_30_54_10]